jgi:hypothetical protein
MNIPTRYWSSTIWSRSQLTAVVSSSVDYLTRLDGNADFGRIAAMSRRGHHVRELLGANSGRGHLSTGHQFGARRR